MDISIQPLRTTQPDVIRTMMNSGPDEYRWSWRINTEDLIKQIWTSEHDRFWGIFCGPTPLSDNLIGLIMLRGWDEGYKRPALGIYIDYKYGKKGLFTLALRYAISWCSLNNVETMLSKVHKDAPILRTHFRAGFRPDGICPDTGHQMLEWRKEIVKEEMGGG